MAHPEYFHGAITGTLTASGTFTGKVIDAKDTEVEAHSSSRRRPSRTRSRSQVR